MEKTLFVTHPTFAARPFLFGAVCLSCLAIVGFPILAVWWIVNRSTKLTITDKRTVLRRGILSKFESEVWHNNVRNVQIYQSFIHRLIGVGNIGISSAGQSGVEIAVRGIPDPSGVQRLINRQRSSRP